MGRLIDETDLKNLLYVLDDARYDLYYAIKKIPELPTVEAIPKDQYENRLKADMMAMLTEIQLEIEEKEYLDGEEPINITQDYIDEVKSWEYGKKDCYKIIQQQIDKLRENKDAV